MLKLLGSALILGAGVWLRWNTLTQRRRMRRVLEECLAALRRMAEEIRMARTALPLLLERLAGQCGPDGRARRHSQIHAGVSPGLASKLVTAAAA